MSEAYWMMGGMVEELAQVVESAEAFLQAGDAEGAKTILMVLLEEVADRYEQFDDSDGELGGFLHELGLPLAEAILSIELNEIERQKLIADLEPIVRELSDYDIDGLEIALAVLAQGWTGIEAGEEWETTGEDECGEELGRIAWIILVESRGALCLSCADLDHFVFLPSGDAALNRRARNHSTLAAEVLKWSRACKRIERQGLLVEAQALEKAEKECLSDGEARARRREREAERREELDREYVDRFTAQIRELFPHCPPGREIVIAEHTCLKYSGRVGRSSAAKSLDENAV